MQVHIPEELKEYVESQVAAGGYSDVAAYVCALVESDREIRRELEPFTSGERVESLLLEGLESESKPMGPEDWSRIHAAVRKRHEERQQG